MGEKEGGAKKPRQALYRQYRSASFDEVVGQEHITSILKQAVTNGSIGHAYLFTGQKGTGKTSVARLLAYAANNIPYENSAQHLDVIEIDAASNRRIDDIRDLREKVHIAPVSAPYKVYIIDEVHMLTGESFNALLKTLEEPPTHAIFILATTELHKVPATIVSRTQRFHFRPVAQSKVVKHLASIAQKEGINVTDDALSLIADYGGGSFRDSIGLLDQLGGLGQEITAELVESILGRAGSKATSSLLGALKERDTTQVQKLLEELSKSGVSPVTFAEQLTRAILKQPNLSQQWYSLTDSLMNIPRSQFPELMLTSTLLKFSSPADTTRTTQPQPKAEKKTSVPQQTKQPEAELGRSETHENKPTETDIHDKPMPEQPAAIIADTKGKFDWDSLLVGAKKTHPALHSVLIHSVPSYQNNRLTLAFKYALHRKKLEQTVYKTQLLRLLDDICHIQPEIIIEDSTLTPKDETASKVADIMGGGESIIV